MANKVISLAEESLECGFPQRASAKAISDARLATDNDDYRGIQVRLNERELDHLYGLRATRQSPLTSHNAFSRDLLKPYERGLYEHRALHGGGPHWGGMIAE